MAEEISLEFIGLALRDIQVETRETRQEMREMREEMRVIRSEHRDLRTVVLSSIDQMRRVRDDLELMIRSEMMGRAAHFETTYERQLGDLRERVEALEQARH